MPNASLRDRFGGWLGRQSEATGFFRLEKTDRWRFVSPEGNAFFAFGLNHWSELTGRALYSGDSSYSVPEMMMPRTLGPHCRGQAERAERLNEFAHAAFARPGSIGWDWCGWDWCGWVNSWVTHQKGRQHSGIQDPFGKYHEPLRRAMRTFASEIYEVSE